MTTECRRSKKLGHLLLVYLVLGVHLVRSTREGYLRKIAACDVAYGTPLHQLENARSFLSCAVECMNTEPCQSLTHDPVTKLCKFNRESWVKPNASGCPGSAVIYTEKVVIDSYMINASSTPSPFCCTSPVNNVRLCDGGGLGVCDPAQGRVEVLYNNVWGTVCDDYFSSGNFYGTNFGNVTCVTLGFTGGTTYSQAYFGEGVGTIWLDDVECMGTETSLFQCPHWGWGRHNCYHYEDVGVMCYY